MVYKKIKYGIIYSFLINKSNIKNARKILLILKTSNSYLANTENNILKYCKKCKIKIFIKYSTLM